MSLPDHILALLLGVILPAAAGFSGFRLHRIELAEREKIALYWSNSAILWLCAISAAAVWLWQGRPLERLGFAGFEVNATALAVSAAIMAAVALETGWQLRSPAARRRARSRLKRLAPFLPANRREYAHFAVLALSAAVCEETVFRGFLIRYLQALFGAGAAATAAAVALPAIPFAAAHLYQGAAAAAKIAALGALLGAVFAATSSLAVPILLHAAVDLLMGLAGVFGLSAILFPLIHRRKIYLKMFGGLAKEPVL